METYVIYQDEEIKIEILKPFHQYLEDTCPQWINLSYGAKDFLYGQVMKDLDIKKEDGIVRNAYPLQIVLLLNL